MKGKFNKQELLALHRHWMWASIIKQHFACEVQKAAARNISDPDRLMPGSYGAYMSIWYGMLFGVLEVFKNKKITLPTIQSDIESVYESLRLYRNAVFHPQEEYYSHKLLAIMKDRESVSKIWKIHSELGGWFLENVKGFKET